MKRNHQGQHLPFECQKIRVNVFEQSTFTEGFSGDANRDALVPVFPPSLKTSSLIGRWLSLKLSYINLRLWLPLSPLCSRTVVLGLQSVTAQFSHKRKSNLDTQSRE